MIDINTFVMILHGFGMILILLIGALFSCVEEFQEREHKREKQKEQEDKEAGMSSSERRESTTDRMISPKEQAMLLANRQSFRLTMDAMEAQQLLQEAAIRHELDPTPAEWYHDAEWRA